MSKKDAYVEKAQAKVEEQSAKLSRLKAQVKGEVADKKIDTYNLIEKLEAKLASAKSQLNEIANATEDKWESLSERFETLSDEVSASVKKFLGK